MKETARAGFLLFALALQVLLAPISITIAITTNAAARITSGDHHHHPPPQRSKDEKVAVVVVHDPISTLNTGRKIAITTTTTITITMI